MQDFPTEFLIERKKILKNLTVLIFPNYNYVHIIKTMALKETVFSYIMNSELGTVEAEGQKVGNENHSGAGWRKLIRQSLKTPPLWCLSGSLLI